MLGMFFIPVLIVVVSLEPDNDVDLFLIVIGCRAYSVAFLLAVGHASIKASSILKFLLVPLVGSS